MFYTVYYTHIVQFASVVSSCPLIFYFFASPVLLSLVHVSRREP